MKKITLLFTAIIFSVNGFSQAPDWAWARSGGSISNDYSNATCADANGNAYIAGTFQGSTLTLGSYTLQNVAEGALDIFIAKYDANGNVLWAKSGGGTRDDYAYGIAADVNGNVYITGYFRSSSVTFGTITLINSDSTGNSMDIFLAKYDSAGNALWAKSVGAAGGYDESFGVCVDADGNVYITGMFGSPTIIFGSYTLTNSGLYDIFIAKYDSGGNVLWVKSAGGTQWDAGQSICTDVSGNVYVTGFFQHHATFGSDTINGYYYANIFVAKYDTYGNKLWAKSAVGSTIVNIGVGTGITSDAGGNVYITGYFEYSVSFGSDTLSNGGTYSIFLAKYDTGGNALWGRSPGGTGYDYGSGICTDVNGNVFMTGYFESSFLNFGGFPVLNANVGYDDIFVAGYDSAGNALWAKSVGGQDYDYGMGICSNTNSDVYVTGYFGSYSLNFGSASVTNNGSYDIFLAKLSSFVGINEPKSSGNNIFIFPNPATSELRIENAELRIREIEIYNTLGERVYSQQQTTNDKQQTVNVSQLLPGVYFVAVTDDKGNKITKRFVKM